MNNSDKWQPTKYVFRRGRLVASTDAAQLGTSSRLIAHLTARLYDQHLKRYCRGRLVDLGSGKVPLFGAYRGYVTENVCVDWLHTCHPNPFIDVECDLSERLPFEDEQFDTIILSDVLEHIAAPDKLWDEMSRILRHNGNLLLNVPFLYWLHEEPHDYYRYTEYALRRMAGSAGFEVVVLEPLGGLPEVMGDIVAKTSVRIPLVGKLLALLIQYATLWFVAVSAGKRISRKTCKKFPLGYFLVAQKAGKNV